MLSLVLALTLQAAEPAPAAEAAPSLDAKAARRAEKERERAEADAKVTCKRRVEPSTSMSREVCMTQAEWRKIDRDFMNNRSGPVRPTTGMLR